MINFTYQAFLQKKSPTLIYCVAHESNVFILKKKINTNQNDHYTAVYGIFDSNTEYKKIHNS